MRAESAGPLERAGRTLLLLLVAHALALAALVLCSGTAGGASPSSAEQRPSEASAPRPAERDALLDLQMRLKDLPLEHDAQGRAVFVLETADGARRLSPQEFAEHLLAVQEDQRAHGFLYVLFNITTPIGFLWVGLGFLGQALFTLRMLLQWYASEKEGRSVLPVGFWWGSLFGGLMLLLYFVWRKDIVGILGQSTGVFVYARNLHLIYRPRPAAAHQNAVPSTHA